MCDNSSNSAKDSRVESNGFLLDKHSSDLKGFAWDLLPDRIELQKRKQHKAAELTSSSDTIKPALTQKKRRKT
ncbi:hypothetical protein GLYMA_20G055400v4 [Glycine max]|uniref:Uncharacterized protein n=1 Tax=Glycine max TaxID=3847 RepID=A0A0R0EH17_SOYBN|nr:hypothetical protein JHK85_056249 [Glycine max]KAG5074059.1 hypothetical protein JHK84_055290 [Glycine max]KAH1034691.1 hypothetical protein GYH30_054900 [Glycine max]KRG89911.1 hypothetical protein GLYMA_20G055400v4 [Glycine max]